MLFLEESAARQWCTSQGLDASGLTPSSKLQFRHPIPRRIRIPAPVGLHAITLALTLLVSDVNDGLSIDFRGGLVWLADWNIWSESTEAVGMALLEATRISANAPPADTAPAQLFEPGEMVGAQIALGLPLLFGWDAYFVPLDLSFIVFVSHHEFADVVPAADSTFDGLFDRYVGADWKPHQRLND
jgi:hypothetical protein